MKCIDELTLNGKRVLIRVDFNVPLDAAGAVADTTRLAATVPTIEFAIKSGAKVVLCSHLGSPKGKPAPALSLRPVVEPLMKLLGRAVAFVTDCIGPEAERAVAALRNGDVLLLENLRFHPGEEKNEDLFADALARLADVYIDDAFATAHRSHASLVGVAKRISEKACGFTVKRELEYFHSAFEAPERPFVAIFGGAKVSTKMNAIRNVGAKADAIIIGGAMANTFFVAAGHNVGRSLFEPDQVENAKAIRADLSNRGCRLVLPSDVVVANELKAGVKTDIVMVDGIPENAMALDVGPRTVESFRAVLQTAKTVIWNGPMGAFEVEGFNSGTFLLIDILAELDALTVVGGGDTDLALHQKHAFDKMSYVSTAGGAFLKLLEGGKLPAIEALG